MAERAGETDLHLTVRRAEDDEERRTREHPKEGDAALSSRMSGYEGVSAVRRDAVLADRTVEAFSSDEPETGQEGHDADRRVHCPIQGAVPSQRVCIVESISRIEILVV